MDKLIIYFKQLFCIHEIYDEYMWGEIPMRECLNCGLKDYESIRNGFIGFHKIKKNK